MRFWMALPVPIELGKTGLDLVVQELRAIFGPVELHLERFPNGWEFGPR